MLHDAIELADEGPVAIRYPNGTAPQVGEHEVGVGLRADRLRRGDGSVCILAIGKLVDVRQSRRPTRSPSTGIDATVWDVRSLRAARPGDDRRRRSATASSSRARTASATAASA